LDECRVSGTAFALFVGGCDSGDGLLDPGNDPGDGPPTTSPEDWVTLWFGTTEQDAGGSQQFQITVDVNEVKSDRFNEGSVVVVDYKWVVASQTYNGLPKTHVLKNPLTITEAASTYSKQADLHIQVLYTPSDPDEDPVTYWTEPGLGVSFHPGHQGMG
jgi:hypothetical protein